MISPIISVVFDEDSDRWFLMATSYGCTELAGERLFRAPPHPAISFQHADEISARKDAALLTAYIREHWTGNETGKKSKTK